MTDAEMWSELSRGCCNKHRVVETGCTTCAGQLAALDRVKAIITAADALREAAGALKLGRYDDLQAANASFDAARGAK